MSILTDNQVEQSNRLAVMHQILPLPETILISTNIKKDLNCRFWDIVRYSNNYTWNISKDSPGILEYHPAVAVVTDVYYRPIDVHKTIKALEDAGWRFEIFYDTCYYYTLIHPKHDITYHSEIEDFSMNTLYDVFVSIICQLCITNTEWITNL